LGFGLLFPKTEELRALYVHPNSGRRGIGRRMLQELESRAAVLGISRLGLNSSLNAEAFYRANGYRTLSRGRFRLSAEYEMDCVRMEKQFHGSPPNTSLEPARDATDDKTVWARWD